tara:strand:+ start:490 stop:1110 length:621 start_codon:yes stop_codon:yes gene_type:complete
MPRLLILLLAACIGCAQHNIKDATRILEKKIGKYSKHGWNHYGPGYFKLDKKTGILEAHGGMGLFWYSKKKYKDFTLQLEYKTSESKANSGIFLRVPDIPVSDDYIYHSFEIQICDAGKGNHKTAAVYDANAASKDVSNSSGKWNHYKINFIDDRITVELNGELVNDWKATPSGKVSDFSKEGYIGLQNHDWDTIVYFRNIFIKEL